MILGKEPKNQVIWTTCCKDISSIYCIKSWLALVGHKVRNKKNNCFVKNMHYVWPSGGIGGALEPP